MPALPYWLWPGDGRPTREIDSEITEELQLHLDLLAEEHERRGLASDDAKRQAAERFGDFDSILRRCRVEKQGDVPMLKRVQATLIGLLLAAIVFMGWQQWAMATRAETNAEATRAAMDYISSRLIQISARLNELEPERVATVPLAQARDANTWTTRLPIDPAAADPRGEWVGSGQTSGEVRRIPTSEAAELFPTAPPVSPDHRPYDEANAYGSSYSPPPGNESKRSATTNESIVVRDFEGKPISDAKLNVTLRNGLGIISRQAVPGATGECVVSIPSGWAIDSIDCSAPGFPFTTYQLDRDPADDQSIDIVMAQAPKVRLQVIGSNGKPARRMSVIPVSRTDLADDDHNAPNHGRTNWLQTDESGRAAIDWLMPGDIATVRLKKRGESIRSAATVKFEVPLEPSKTVSIALAAPDADPDRGGYGGGYGEYGAGGYGGGYGGNKQAPYHVDLIDSDETEASSD